jgi:hypothetical protein
MRAVCLLEGCARKVPYESSRFCCWAHENEYNKNRSWEGIKINVDGVTYADVVSIEYEGLSSPGTIEPEPPEVRNRVGEGFPDV